MFNMTGPCGNCPFRSDRYFYLVDGRRQEIAEDLERGATFHCHKTVDHDEDTGEGIVTGNSQFCGGALVVMAKEETLYDNQMVRIADRLGLFDEDRLNMNAPVYDSLTDFVADQRPIK